MIRKTIAWLLVLTCALTQADAQEFINDKIDILPGSSTYYLNEVVYKPANFSTVKKYPLVIFAHGMGEAGTDVNRLYNTGLPYVLKSGYKPSFEFIMVAVQHNSYSLDPKYVQQVLDETIKKFPNIDQTRIYLTGLSAGGFTTYGSELNVDTALAKKFAGMVVMSGAVQDVNKANISWWKSSKTPLWAVVGNSDPSYRDQNQDLVNQINQQVPGLASITIRDGVGHGGWNDVYNGMVKTANGKTMWEWLYQFTRGGSTGSTTTPPPANTAPTDNAGTDKNLTLPTSAVALSGTASDADGSIASVSWSKVSGPAQFSFSNTAVLTPTVSSLVSGTYTFRLTVTDNQGASASDDINVVVNSGTVIPSTGTKYIKVNLFGGANAYTNTEWNNWNVSSSLSLSNIKYNDGSTSSVKASLSNQNSVSDNGSTYSVTMAPKEVVRYASYSASNRTLSITGLDNTKTYDLELYASRNGVSNNTTRFTVGGINVDVKTDNNSASKASFSGLVPTSGTITINISKLNTYNYLNGFTLTQR